MQPEAWAATSSRILVACGMLTREQVAALLLRCKYGPGYLPPFSQQSLPVADIRRTHWAVPWICQSVAEGLWQMDEDENVYPNRPACRDELGRPLSRTFGTIGNDA